MDFLWDYFSPLSFKLIYAPFVNFGSKSKLTWRFRSKDGARMSNPEPRAKNGGWNERKTGASNKSIECKHLISEKSCTADVPCGKGQTCKSQPWAGVGPRSRQHLPSLLGWMGSLALQNLLFFWHFCNTNLRVYLRFLSEGLWWKMPW